MKVNYIFLYYKENNYNLSFHSIRDLLEIDDVSCIPRNFCSKVELFNKIYKKIRYGICRKKFIYYLFLPLLNLCEKINSFKFKKNERYVIYINDQGLDEYYTTLLKKITKKNKNVSIVVHWLNVVSSIENRFYNNVISLNADLVLTDDPGDAKKYNWIFWPDCMSNICKCSSNSNNQLFFVGKVKDREDKLIDIYDFCSKNDIKCDFVLVGAKTEKKGVSTGWIDYDNVLQKDANSSCVLEIMQNGQEGYTCRAQECIMLNKKLITDNKWIKNSKFYNSDYIHVFEKFGIDEINFIKKEINVDYHYNGEFSPIELIRFLSNKL